MDLTAKGMRAPLNAELYVVLLGNLYLKRSRESSHPVVVVVVVVGGDGPWSSLH